MTASRQLWVITLVAVAGFFGLRSLPDTQCTFLHADHQPVVVDGLEFCGLNEEANFYSPKALRFPVELKAALDAAGTSGELRLLKDDGHPYYAHEIAVSHTQRVHLHLRQIGGAREYAHLHPQPAADGSWRFEVPVQLRGLPLRAYVDFTDVRTARTMLAEAEVALPEGRARASASPVGSTRNRIVELTASTTQTGSSAMIRLQLAGPAGQTLRLKPIMGSLGHAVVFSADRPAAGYAHMHPTLEGGEYADNPTLAFRLRLPAPGTYDFWLNLNDGQDELLRATLVVTP
jgi:hypothetical protein